MEILKLKDVKITSDSYHPYWKGLQEQETPIVIDNGSFTFRAGWATSEKPQLMFKNLIAKPRKERGKKDGELQVGNDISNIEAVRFQLKTQFDRNVVTHIDIQEHVLDYTFSHLGIDTEGSINHPLVVTETVLNPNYSRMLMSELLFECYKVPEVAYGVDSLFSLQRNGYQAESSLVVSLGYQSTHVIPVIEGVVDWALARRVDVGGCQITGYLHRLLQLKYPSHYSAITLSRAEELLHEHCFIAENYGQELSKWSNEEHYESHVRKIQLPYTVGLSTEQQREKRRELARRLMEMNARKREQKLAEDEEQLNHLLSLEENVNEEETERVLKLFNLSSPGDLKQVVHQIQERIERTRQKIVNANTTDETNNDEIKVKTSKYMAAPKDEEDLQSWIVGAKKRRQEILDRRNIRRQRRQDMARRRTVAAQERMRLINQLARKEKKDDDFGMRDEDWDVYKAINKEGGDTDSDEESEKLLELEEMLRCHDPMFSEGSVGGGAGVTPGEAHQLHVGVERMRAPELLFQPSMVGCPQTGLAETVQFVLNAYDKQTAATLANKVFLTGSCALIPGLKERIVKELRKMRPFKSTFFVYSASDPVLDAWLGARDFANSEMFHHSCMSRKDYFEKGGEYLKEHQASNLYSLPLVSLKLADTHCLSSTMVQEEIEIDIIQQF